jgi:hypothetical protein
MVSVIGSANAELTPHRTFVNPYLCGLQYCYGFTFGAEHLQWSARTQLDLHLSTSIYIRFRLFRSLLSVAPLLLLDFIQYSEYGTCWRAVLLMGIFLSLLERT